MAAEEKMKKLNEIECCFRGDSTFNHGVRRRDFCWWQDWSHWNHRTAPHYVHCLAVRQPLPDDWLAGNESRERCLLIWARYWQLLWNSDLGQVRTHCTYALWLVAGLLRREGVWADYERGLERGRGRVLVCLVQIDVFEKLRGVRTKER